MTVKHIYEDSGMLHSSQNSASSRDRFNFYHDVVPGNDCHVMCTLADILPLFLKLEFPSLQTSLQQNRKRQMRSSDIYSHHWNGLPHEQ